MTDVASLWSYLATTPLIWLTTTILAYLLADGLARRSGNPPWANPVLLSVLLIAPVLWLTQTDYTTYFEGAQPQNRSAHAKRESRNTGAGG